MLVFLKWNHFRIVDHMIEHKIFLQYERNESKEQREFPRDK